MKNLSQNMSYAHYNNLNLPDSVAFLFGSSLTMHYSADGRRIRTLGKTYSTPISVPSDDGEYSGTPFSVFDEIKERVLTLHDGVPVRYDFDGGYYSLQNDSTGLAELTPYLYETDLQGSVRTVKDAESNEIVQSMEYLPDGAVFRSENYPLQPYRYGGKEEVSLHGWQMYDSHARWQYARLPRFSTVDPLAEKYYHLSPYAYCGNDFVNCVDPSGMIIDDNFLIKEGFKQYLTNQKKYIETVINEGLINKKTGVKLRRFYDTCLTEIEQLENSKQRYIILLDPSVEGGVTTYDFTANTVVISVNSDNNYGVIAHELCHAYQFEIGEISFMEDNTCFSTLTDISDETNAYNRQRVIEYGRFFFETPYALVNGFHYKFSNKDTYKWGLSMKTPAYINLPSKRKQLSPKYKIIMDNNRIRYKVNEAYIGWKE